VETPEGENSGHSPRRVPTTRLKPPPQIICREEVVAIEVSDLVFRVNTVPIAHKRVARMRKIVKS
jgi:hypothetical protein